MKRESPRSSINSELNSPGRSRPWGILGASGAIVGLLACAGLGLVFNRKKPDPPQPSPPSIASVAPKVEEAKPRPSPKIRVLPPVVPEVLAVFPRECVPPSELLRVMPRPTPEVLSVSPRVLEAKETPQAIARAKLAETAPGPERFGTSIDFLPTATAAFDAARRDKTKLVLIIHFAGSFQDGLFTCDKAEQIRQECLRNKIVAKLLNDHFYCAGVSVSGQREVNGKKSGGNLASYICHDDTRVLNVIPGPVDAESFISELRWTLDHHSQIQLEAKTDTARFDEMWRKAHRSQFLATVGQSTPTIVGMLSTLRRLNGLPPLAQAHGLLASRFPIKWSEIYQIVFLELLKESIVRP